VAADDEDVLARYARHEAAAEAGTYRRYREVLAAGLRGVAEELGFEPSVAELEAFSVSVREWPAFPDSSAALTLLRTRYRLGVITNCDDDLFAASNERLGVAFDWIVTAEQVGAYKPAEANFHLAFERIGLPRERILHVAQSLYHDHVPARRLGLTSVWIDRRHDRVGAGATPVAEAEPDATFPDMASFAAAATA
jgi:2-haloacid dehalogenase